MNTEEDIHVKDTNITNIKDEKLDQTSIEDILDSDPDVPSTGRFDFVVRHWITGVASGVFLWYGWQRYVASNIPDLNLIRCYVPG